MLSSKLLNSPGRRLYPGVKPLATSFVFKDLDLHVGRILEFLVASRIWGYVHVT